MLFNVHVLLHIVGAAPFDLFRLVSPSTLDLSMPPSFVLSRADPSSKSVMMMMMTPQRPTPERSTQAAPTPQEGPTQMMMMMMMMMMMIVSRLRNARILAASP